MGRIEKIGLETKAKNYEWAEQAEELKKGTFYHWPKSLYRPFGTNSNVFVRYIAGSLFKEMNGWHPPKRPTPSQNTILEWTFFANHTPWKGSPNKPKPSGP